LHRLKVNRLAVQLDDPERAEAAAKELARIAGQESVPILVKALDSRLPGVRDHCLAGLERLRSPKSARVVARLLADRDGEQAVRVLQAIGAPAEAEVRPYLRHAGHSVRLRACRVLEEIGTRASLPDLRSRKEDENAEVRTAASTALRAIESREKRD
jgi:HEAT repeat protein